MWPFLVNTNKTTNVLADRSLRRRVSIQIQQKPLSWWVWTTCVEKFMDKTRMWVAHFWSNKPRLNLKEKSILKAFRVWIEYTYIALEHRTWRAFERSRDSKPKLRTHHPGNTENAAHQETTAWWESSLCGTWTKVCTRKTSTLDFIFIDSHVR